MACFFHATPHGALASVLAHGLDPGIGPRSKMIGETEAAIYLFDDLAILEDAIGGWLGDALAADGNRDAALLEIDAAAVERPMQDGFSHSTAHPIPAGAIRLLRIEPLDG